MKIIPTTELSLMELKIRITKKINAEKLMCTKCLVRTVFFLVFSLLSMPKKSTQKEVVRAVKAESVVAKVAAIIPSKNTIAGMVAK
ncbi:hypothetical protein D3C87_1851250 [compost metagenome]